MRRSPESPLPRRLCLPLPLAVALAVHILTMCLYPAQAAAMSSVYNTGSPYSHRQYDQTSLPIPREQFTNAFKGAVGDVSASLRSHADKFDAFFRDLLKVSHHNFDQMFANTYGILYDRHASIFNDMFRDLNHYYTTGSVDLTASLKQFFSLLYKKMFEELNSQYAFDATYLECTVEHMEEMMPFGEMPQKLIQQIKRSFIAIRTFVQALKYGNEVLKNIMDAPITSLCENRLRSMSYCRNCPSAPGHNLNAPCQETCVVQVEKACFPYGANLNREWNLYVNDIAKLANRLKTSFNIELAVKPINIQISEAIMIFQDNADAISKRLFSKCGKPGPKRAKRNAYLYNQRLPAKPSYTTAPPRNLPLMESLIGDILKTLKNYKNFWSRLPRHLCSQYSNSLSNCNNITTRHTEPLNYRDKNNVEIVNLQISTLKLISSNVNNAYNGLDVDLENNLRHSNEAASGNVPIDDEISGSGEELSGSGDHEELTTEMAQSGESSPSSSSTTNDWFFSSTMSTTAATESASTAIGATKDQGSASSATGHHHRDPPLLTLLLGALLLQAFLLFRC